jgi:hypothetical protein
LLMSGCSIQLACNEVHFFSSNPFQPFLFHIFYYDRFKYFQVGLARTTFYRWLERIRRMQADSSWASVSESYRMFVLTTDTSENLSSSVFIVFSHVQHSGLPE